MRLLLPIRNIRRVIREPVAKEDIIDELAGERKILGEILQQHIVRSKVRQAGEPPIANTINQRVIEISAFECAPEQKEYLPPCARVLRILKSRVYEDNADGREKLLDWARKEIHDETKCLNPRVSDAVVISGEFVGTLGNSVFRGKLFFGIDWWPCLSRPAKLSDRAYRIESALRIFQVDVSRIADVAPIQVDTSYEKTIADLQSHFVNKAVLQDVQEFFFSGSQSNPVWLVIRIGNSAVCTFKFEDGRTRNVANDGQSCASANQTKLFFHVNRPAPTRPTGLGDMTAYRWILMLSIVCSVAFESTQCFEEPCLDGIERTVEDGVKAGVYASHACFLSGFGINFDGKEKLPREYFTENANPTILFGKYVSAGLSLFVERFRGSSKGFASVRFLPRVFPADIVLPEFSSGGSPRQMEKIKEDVMVCVVPLDLVLGKNIFWRLSSSCTHWPSENDDFSKHIEKAVLVVKGSPQNASFPVVRIGKLELIDRFEIQDYLFLNGLLQDYAEDHGRVKPLSISVFGQPGSGKSFGVRELVQAMSGGRSLYSSTPMTFNLSQLRTVPDLIAAFHQIRDACLRGPIPLIFFDEFDSQFEGEPFGWLKYFLAPMEDGEFSEARTTFHFGRSVFVFAGGVNHTFAEFNERARHPQFCWAKGPDFISRLRGALNIRSINRPEDDAIQDGSYLQRRAYILWQVLKDKTGLRTEAATDEVIRAFVKVGRFKHGVRSLKAIIEMSRVGLGMKLSVGHLPPRDQLEMHVDAREFLGFASGT
jgi:hypothetical protein